MHFKLYWSCARVMIKFCILFSSQSELSQQPKKVEFKHESFHFSVLLWEMISQTPPREWFD